MSEMFWQNLNFWLTFGNFLKLQTVNSIFFCKYINYFQSETFFETFFYIILFHKLINIRLTIDFAIHGLILTII